MTIARANFLWYLFVNRNTRTRFLGTLLHSSLSTCSHSCLAISWQLVLVTVLQLCFGTWSHFFRGTDTQLSLGTCSHFFWGTWRQVFLGTCWQCSLGTSWQVSLGT